MNPLSITVVLVLLVGVRANIGELQPECDSPEAEEAALAAQDYLNAQHTHGYKYALNRIEDIKILTTPEGEKTYVLEIDLLETFCHVVDPTPVANCTIRPKRLTAVEGDCDVVLKRVGGALTVTAFKCRTGESTEDMCLGCPVLLPLNDTAALDFVSASLATFNNITINTTYSLVEVGRMSVQASTLERQFIAEYVVIEANCTDDVCVPMNGPMVVQGTCVAQGTNIRHTVDCKTFFTKRTVVDVNDTAVASPRGFNIHAGRLSRRQGLRHHVLTTHYDPYLSGLVSAESPESIEYIPILPGVLGPAIQAMDPAMPAGAPAVLAHLAGASNSGSASVEVPLVLVKREVPAAAVDPIIDNPVLVPVCPGRVRFF